MLPLERSNVSAVAEIHIPNFMATPICGMLESQTRPNTKALQSETNEVCRICDVEDFDRLFAGDTEN